MTQTPIKGIMIHYFATGEAARAQFIGNKSLDSNGMVCNHDEIYDIEVGDRITFKNEVFNQHGLFEVTDRTILFISGLAMLWNSEKHDLEVEFIPSKTSKSWAELANGK